jgi:hypothetical protein
MPNANGISLDSLAGGALQEQIQDALKVVLENIKDPNTNYKTKRKLTINLTFASDDKRELAEVAMEVKPTLAAALPSTTRIIIDRDKEGHVVCAEYRKGIPGQLTMGVDEAGAVTIEQPPHSLKVVGSK